MKRRPKRKTAGATVDESNIALLRAVQQTLRDLQKLHGRVSWRVEQSIGRIDHELNRRAVQ